MKSLLILVDSVVTIYIWILIINAILSWLIAFNVLNMIIDGKKTALELRE